MKNIKIVTLFIFSVFSLLSCQNKKMEEKFNWSGGICAPAEYQMQCYYGRIIADDFLICSSEIINGGEIRKQLEANKNQSVKTPSAIQSSITFLFVF